MKIIISVLFIISSFTAYAQNISIKAKLIDKVNKEPISFAYVQIENSNLGTVANSTGEFLLTIPKEYHEETLLISCIGYKSYRVSIQITKQDFVVEMERDAQELQEVIVQAESAKDLLKKCLQNIPTNYSQQPQLYTGFLRNINKNDGQIVEIDETVFKIYRDSASKHVPADFYLVKGRFIEDIYARNQIHGAMAGMSTQGIALTTDIHDIIFNLKLKDKAGINKNYEFKSLPFQYLNGRKILVVYFNQKDKVKQPLLEGKIYIDALTYAFVKFDYSLSPKGIRYIKKNHDYRGININHKSLPVLPDVRLKSSHNIIEFKLYQGKWYLDHYNAAMNLDWEYDLAKQNKKIDWQRELIITQIDTLINTIENKKIVSNHLPAMLKAGYAAFDKEYWQDLNILPYEISVKQIATEIQGRNKAWQKVQRQKVALRYNTGKKRFSTKELKLDYKEMRTMLEKVHPALYWHTSKKQMNQYFDSTFSLIKESMYEEDFLKLLKPIIEKIHCGHTFAEPSFKYRDYQKYFMKGFPFSVKIIDNKMYTDQNYSSSIISKGSEIISINNITTGEILKKLRSSIPSDGYHISFKNWCIETDFPSLYNLCMDKADTFQLEFIPYKSTDKKDVLVSGILFEELEQKDPKQENYEFRMLDSIQTGILTIRSFMPSNSGKEYAIFLKEIFEEINRKNIRNLVIDLRGNTGGRDDFGSLLYSYLADSSFNYYTYLKVATRDSMALKKLNLSETIKMSSFLPEYLSHIKNQDSILIYDKHKNLSVQKAQANNFKGKVYILMNGGSFSTTSEFISIAHSNKRSEFIGEESGGYYYGNSSGAVTSFILPNTNIRIGIPLQQYVLSVSGYPHQHRGLIPDYQTKSSVEELNKNSDIELNYVLQLISVEK